MLTTITGEEFIKLFAPNTIRKINTANWLFGNQAVWNGETLLVSSIVYGCLADSDTAFETLKTLQMKCVLRENLPRFGEGLKNE